jgi:hypothetical protein
MATGRVGPVIEGAGKARRGREAVAEASPALASGPPPA